MRISHWITAAGAGVLFGTVVAFAAELSSPAPDMPSPPSLKTVQVPEPPNLYDFVANKAAAIQLGKALFWDMQIGSDGATACATCHFHAGADSRSINQLHPGARTADPMYAPPGTWQSWMPNAQLTKDFFPLRKLTNPGERGSTAAADAGMVVSSQGVFHTQFVAVVPGYSEEQVKRPPDPDGFQVAGLNVRRVEPRNTPSVINAVFNHRNFWDGRAQNEFNGINEWGDREPNAVLFKRSSTGALQPVRVRLVNSSLASQAVAPILSSTEMSAEGRIAPDLGNKLSKVRGKKLSKLRPLGRQLVHPEDSVLGSLTRWPNAGLAISGYEALIKRAFRAEWWDSKQVIRVAADGTATVLADSKEELAENEYRLIEYNFSLFFGLALQLYQATLVSDDTPYDRWKEGKPSNFSADAMEGLRIFLSQDKFENGIQTAKGGRCINCHGGAEFTDASVSNITKAGLVRFREGQDLDRGWNNIGVRPTREDLGVGGRDKFGNWLSVARRLRGADNVHTPPYVAVDGAFKAPGLRNVELTAPYFHNGGYLTLEGVVEFYSRGGDLAPLWGRTATLQGIHWDFGHTAISPLSAPQFTPEQQKALVAFLKSLTDDRVKFRRAPFDHPQLWVPDGQLAEPDPHRPGQALDRWREIPPVGRNGGPALPNFLQQ